jgi:hypothetical protein
MFESSFTRELIRLGYEDAMNRRDDLMGFLCGAPLAATTTLPALELADVADQGLPS